MSIRKRMSTGILISAFALGGLAGCASGDETSREEEEVAEQSVGEEWEEAGQATAEAAEDTADKAADKTKSAAKNAGETVAEGAQKAEETAKDAQHSTKVAGQRAENTIQGWIGGGPVESDTAKKIDEIEREMQNYREGIQQQNYQLDDVTKLKMQQIEERAQLVKKQYNELAQQQNMGIAEIDAEMEGLAEEVLDDWEDLEDDLEVELGKSYEDMNDN